MRYICANMNKNGFDVFEKKKVLYSIEFYQTNHILFLFNITKENQPIDDPDTLYKVGKNHIILCQQVLKKNMIPYKTFS